MKNKIEKVNNISLIRRLKFWDYVAIALLISFLYYVSIVPVTIIEMSYLKRSGKWTKAVLKHELVTYFNRQHYARIMYEFTYKGKKYEGNSLEDDLSTIGDSICVVYLESFPSVNRPVKYFDKGEIKCSCK